MKRFFVEKITDNMVLKDDNHNHLSFVLRARVGDIVVLCQQDGYDYEAVIDSITKTQTSLHIVNKYKNQTEASINVTLFVAMLKGEKLDYVVQKITELGLNAVYPVVTKYVQNKKEQINLTRINKIAVEAAKQCGRAIVPKMNDIIAFDKMTDLLSSFDLVVFPYEKATNPDIKSFLSQPSVTEKAINSVAIIIGSEGGFADEEVAEIIERNVTPITLGKRILRAETACVTVSGVVMYELGQWR